jgi:hypothetical protein
MSLGDQSRGKAEDEREGTRSPRSAPKAPKMRGIKFELSPLQVQKILREATGADGLRELLGEQAGDLRVAIAGVMADPEFDYQRMSYSALKALSVLCAFTPRGTARRITKVGDELGMSHSTVYRYARTFSAVGLLEQVDQRKYRIPPGPGEARETPRR